MDRRILLTGLSLAGVAVSAIETSSAIAQDQGGAKSLIGRFASTLSAHDMEGFASLFADGYVNHQIRAAAPPSPAGVTPKQGTVRFFAGRVKGMPDLKVTIEASVASGDSAAASFAYEGTPTGDYLRAAPTGRRLRFTSCDIFRVADGKIVEHWGMGDTAGIMAKLKS